ncbi:MAG: hypothetical protein JSV96_01650 [Candidatus Aminicenantes bacterium]|nr:MAG: hypothetical protein JSV96_01650 [Candidatus Aminicenantes bacterium]
MIKRPWEKDSLRVWIYLLIDIRKKLKRGEQLSSKDDQILSSALGIKEFRDEKDKEKKLVEFFHWAITVLKKED